MVTAIPKLQNFTNLRLGAVVNRIWQFYQKKSRNMVNVPCNTKYIPPLSSIQIFFRGWVLKISAGEGYTSTMVQVHVNSSLNTTQYIRQPWNSNFTQTRSNLHHLICTHPLCFFEPVYWKHKIEAKNSTQIHFNNWL